MQRSKATCSQIHSNELLQLQAQQIVKQSLDRNGRGAYAKIIDGFQNKNLVSTRA